jgi:hypothetical protein
MNNRATHRQDSSRSLPALWPLLFLGAIAIEIVLAGLPAHASESQTPWECSSYTGDAHTRCVKAFVESQRDQTATLQEKIKAQEETVTRLKDQLDRQASTSADLQRQLTQRPAVVQTAPPLYAYSYAYPSVGLGLYFGSPWIYEPSLFYRPSIYGPRHFGLNYWGHHW